MNAPAILKNSRMLPNYGPLGLRQHFGATGDGTSFDDHSVRAWWAAGVERRQPLHIDYGHYRLRQPLIFDLCGLGGKGITVTGDGQTESVFELADVQNDTPFQRICSHTPMDDPDSEVSAFDVDFSGFSVVTRFDGPGGMDGRNEIKRADRTSFFPDALNSCYLKKFKIDNSCDSPLAETFRVNHVLQSQYDIRANGHSRPNKNNRGIAMHLRQAKFCVIKGGMSNANIGQLWSGGANSSNTCLSIDFEEGNTAIVIDDEAGGDTRNNVWITPHIAYRHGLDFRSGVNNVVQVPNDGLRQERYNANGKHVGNNRGWFVINDVGLVKRDWIEDFTSFAEFDRQRRHIRAARAMRQAGFKL